jgi:hypothetical protein
MYICIYICIPTTPRIRRKHHTFVASGAVQGSMWSFYLCFSGAK